MFLNGHKLSSKTLNYRIHSIKCTKHSLRVQIVKICFPGHHGWMGLCIKLPQLIPLLFLTNTITVLPQNIAVFVDVNIIVCFYVKIQDISAFLFHGWTYKYNACDDCFTCNCFIVHYNQLSSKS